MEVKTFNDKLVEEVLENFTSHNINDEEEPIITPEELTKVIKIYDKIYQVLVDEKVDMWTGLKILSTMADTISYYMMKEADVAPTDVPSGTE